MERAVKITGIPGLQAGSYSTAEMAGKILKEILLHRRVAEPGRACRGIDCEVCAARYLPKIMNSVRQGKPVSFVLPAFPGKSPNREKVLGYLPDFAEQISLRFLGSLAEKIRNFYAPGIRIRICSDGRVFSDVVGMQESHITAYQNEMSRLIARMRNSDISTFNLDDVYEGDSFIQMRSALMKQYGESPEALRLRVRNGAKEIAAPEEREALRMYRGITRFMFEDSVYPGQVKSRTALQKEARKKAYDVILRSNAWSCLIAEMFPSAVRLSIHPQVCGSEKLGICLIGNESWMTPWHGVVVETGEGYTLVKRREAESMNAKLVCFADGRPSHYRVHSGPVRAEGVA